MKIKLRQTNLRGITEKNSYRYVERYFGLGSISTQAMTNGTAKHTEIEEYINKNLTLPEYISEPLKDINIVLDEWTLLEPEKYHELLLLTEEYEGVQYDIYLTGTIDLVFDKKYIIDWKTQLKEKSSVTISNYLNSGQAEIYSLFEPEVVGGAYVKIYNNKVIDKGFVPIDQEKREATKALMLEKAKIYFEALKPFL